jgi:kumamolisin
MTQSGSYRHLTSRRALAAVAAIGVTIVMSAGAATAGTTGSSGGSGGTISVAQGTSSVPLDSGQPLGSTDPSTPVDISVILRARNLSQLDSAVQSGWRGHYLSTSQFAAQYGQSPFVIHAIEAYLNHFGITTSAYADGLDISANGTAGEFNQALNVSLQNFRVRSASPNVFGHSRSRTVYASPRDPRLPRSVGGPILAILGLSNYAPFASHAVPAKGHNLNEKPAAGTGIPAGDGLGPQDFDNLYNLTPLQNHGGQGQGRTIGIVTLASLDPNVPLAFWNNVLGLNEPASRLTLETIDGGAGPISEDAGSDESDLDVEQSGAIAPRANVRVYVAPNSDPGFADAFFAAASEDIADSVSASWGESESYLRAAIANSTESAAYAQVFDEAFAEMGAQGQSTFTSAGDFGAYDALPDQGTTDLTTDNPSDSPYITAAGGTTLAGTQTYGFVDADGNPTGATDSINIPTEIGWAWDYLWPLWNLFGEPDEATAATDGDFPLGGGGGYSSVEPRPSYQHGVSQFNDREFLTSTTPVEQAPGLTLPTAFSFNPTPALQSGQVTTGRATPDVSTDGDPQTGYAVYDPSLFGGDGFAQFGGTSFVAPQLNASTADIDSAVGHRVGFWNPDIYQWANGRHSPFTPINDTTVYSGVKYLYQTDASGNVTALPGEFTNSNLFYTGKPGSTWNPDVGLGTPNLTALAQDFAAQH